MAGAMIKMMYCTYSSAQQQETQLLEKKPTIALVDLLQHFENEVAKSRNFSLSYALFRDIPQNFSLIFALISINENRKNHHPKVTTSHHFF